jgi:CBS domain-containing protein
MKYDGSHSPAPILSTFASTYKVARSFFPHVPWVFDPEALLGGVMSTKVQEVMTDRPRCVSPDTPVAEAAQLMEAEDVGALPVLDGEVLVGMLTDRDIVVRAVAKGKDPRGMPVRDVATRELVGVHPDQSLDDALRVMAQHQVRRLPVVDAENRLVGVVSQADLALQAKEKDVGGMLEEISKPPTGPRV